MIHSLTKPSARKKYCILSLALLALSLAMLMWPSTSFAAYCYCSDGNGTSVEGACSAGACDGICPEQAPLVDCRDCISDNENYCLQVPLPGGFAKSVSGPAEYISEIFRLALAIVGVVALVILIIAGATYVFSAGNEALISDAKDRIVKALIGLLLVFSSWVILNTINPDFLTLRDQDLEAPAKGPSLDEVLKRIHLVKEEGEKCSSNFECSEGLVCREVPSWEWCYIFGPGPGPGPCVRLIKKCQPPAAECDYCDDDSDCPAGLRCTRWSLSSCRTSLLARVCRK